MGALIRVLGGDTRSFSDTPIAALYFLLKHVKEHLVARARQSLGAIFFVTTLFYFVLSASAAAKGCTLALYLMNIKYETSQELLEVPNGIQYPIVLLWKMGTWHIVIK